MQYKRLKEVINEKGYKLEFIAKELGITPIGLNYKIKGKLLLNCQRLQS